MPEGDRLFAVSRRRPLRLWQTNSVKLLEELPATVGRQRPRAVVYSTDGKQAAAGLSDGTVALRDSKTGRLLDQFQVRPGA